MPTRDAILTPLYRILFRHALRRLDPERAHHLTIGALRLTTIVPGGSRVLRTVFGTAGTRTPATASTAERTALGHSFSSPLGMAAGFDKDARVAAGLLDLGFGHVEVGTITPRPQPGNPAPRCFRLVEDECLINRMGFNNDGAVAAARRLARLRATPRGRDAMIGVNIGKNKTTPPEDAAEDYRAGARLLAPYASYLAINVSSPNTPGLRDLQSTASLQPILDAVMEEAAACKARTGRTVPVLVKIAPDLHDDDVRAVARLARDRGLAGVIATNTTIERPASLHTDRARLEEIGAGGLSGPVLAGRAAEVLRLLREELPADAVVISCGGIRTADDARQRLAAGADLIQGYTALVYEGPGWPGVLARGLRGR
ncbi:MAG: quinone-dependent dihydroorotate dehydrogenase [Brachybacterium sp.]|nr:quinone-dependent dihydroorotate dehydrogenase [Brachybacterium sp.]